jgi:predicted phosphoadenosine phosphosulfate sulfurtransferase
MTQVRIAKKGSMNVVDAAKVRMLNIFNSGLPVYLAFSGGKDSLVMAHIIRGLIEQGKVDAKQVRVIFVDEEAIFPDVERVVMNWRETFLSLGSEFRWYCLEVRHYNCFNKLENDESFICWDRNKKKDWIRPQPDFAIKYHPELRIGKDAYQAFFPRITRDGVQIFGVRLAESIQRASYFAASMKHSGGTAPVKSSNSLLPIYDWKDNDVWLYLQENRIDYPMEYVYLWQVGTNKRRLRISQFFSIDTAGALVSMGEFYPNLMEKVTKREPNAYLASLYWDSEMFRRSSTKRRKLEEDTPDGYYKEKVLSMMQDIKGNFDTPKKQKDARDLLRRISNISHMMIERDWKVAHSILVAGDPKQRSQRGMFTNALHRYSIEVGAQKGWKDEKKGKGKRLKEHIELPTLG